MLFTSLQEVEDFNRVDAQVMWLGEFEDIRFSFNSRSYFYKQANLFHYVGDAVYSDMSTQIVASAAELLTAEPICSNSMPLWLELNGYIPPNYAVGFSNPVTLYPAMLSPQNLEPPYATVDIVASQTEPLSGLPGMTSNLSHYQLMTDTVTVTLWGLRNTDALTFLDCVLAYSAAYDRFGIMNTPAIRDEKRNQSELNALAQKKSVTFQISYYQYAARAVARQLIEEASVAYIPAP